MVDGETLDPAWEFTYGSHGSTSILDVVMDCDAAREVLQMDVNFRFQFRSAVQDVVRAAMEKDDPDPAQPPHPAKQHLVADVFCPFQPKLMALDQKVWTS